MRTRLNPRPRGCGSVGVQRHLVAELLGFVHVARPLLRRHGHAVREDVAIAPDTRDAVALVPIGVAAHRLALVQLDHELLIRILGEADEEVHAHQVRSHAFGEGLRLRDERVPRAAAHDSLVHLVTASVLGDNSLQIPARLVGVDVPGPRLRLAAPIILADNPDEVRLAPDDLHLGLKGNHGRAARAEELLHRDARLQDVPEVRVCLPGELTKDV
mmetsp:Transcript_25590/g.67985  ORF Transcript_25590/g.67985 Transcript_25590/m.67985 type:complete len:215 (+) Transcript_25590:70-714(+)